MLVTATLAVRVTCCVTIFCVESIAPSFGVTVTVGPGTWTVDVFIPMHAQAEEKDNVLAHSLGQAGFLAGAPLSSMAAARGVTAGSVTVGAVTVIVVVSEAVVVIVVSVLKVLVAL